MTSKPLDPTRKYPPVSMEELTGVDMYVIKSATGVDVLNPTIQFDFSAAMVWWSARAAGDTLSIKDLRRCTLDELEAFLDLPDDDLPVVSEPAAPDGDEEPDEVPAADPTKRAG